MEPSEPHGRESEKSPAAYRLELAFGSVRGELALVAFFVLAACLLTWPLVITPGSASGLRGDYFNNIWNGWWVRHSIVEGHSPYWTDFLYYPDGISLRRHTLSPVNSLFQAALAPALGSHAAFSMLLLAHFALSGWVFSLLARAVTGSVAGGVLGGLLYSFSPFHAFYLCQVNVFSFEFLPLALLFFARYLARGTRADLVGLALSLAGTVMSAEYYVVYAYLTGAILWATAGKWAPEVGLRTRSTRALVAGALGALVVAVVAFPLLYATLGPERGAETGTAAFSVEKHRSNDLCGFHWIGPKEESIVSWPTMLGYSTLVLVLVGLRRVLRLWPWLIVGVFFLVLSLGESLEIAGRDTGIPMPYALFGYVPVLSMLRKSDRAFLMVQLVVSLAAAGALAALLQRLRAWPARAGAFGLCAALPMLEIGPWPLGRYEIPTSPHLRELARDPSVHAVMEIPAARTHVANGRLVYFQTLHGKKSTLGYTTALAVTELHDDRVADIVNWYWQFVFERSRILVRKAREFGVDRILHYKTIPASRNPDTTIDGKVLWQPFLRVRDPLLFVRQVGEFRELSLERSFSEVVQLTVPELVPEIPYERASLPFLDVVRREFSRACGPPVYEDEYVMEFAVAP